MTLLTVDAKLMPILPLIARPTSKDALVVAFGMGLVVPLGADRRPPDRRRRAGAVRARRCSATTTRTRPPVLANPNGHVIIADGRNHLELTDKHYDIIVTDPPPPIESSGASVISSREYYQAGYDHLTPGGIMMEWVPYGQTIEESRRTSAPSPPVFPNVTMVFGPGGYGMYMLGSVDPIAFDPRRDRGGPRAPGHPRRDLERVRQPDEHDRGLDGPDRRRHWLSGTAVTDFVGTGPMVTDDRPVSEYFLIRKTSARRPRRSRSRRP